MVIQGCTDTGAPIMVPVGQETLGRIMNVIGEPVDERGPINSKAKVRKRKETIVRRITSGEGSRTPRNLGYDPTF